MAAAQSEKQECNLQCGSGPASTWATGPRPPSGHGSGPRVHGVFLRQAGRGEQGLHRLEESPILDNTANGLPLSAQAAPAPPRAQPCRTEAAACGPSVRPPTERLRMERPGWARSATTLPGPRANDKPQPQRLSSGLSGKRFLLSPRPLNAVAGPGSRTGAVLIYILSIFKGLMGMSPHVNTTEVIPAPARRLAPSKPPPASGTVPPPGHSQRWPRSHRVCVSLSHTHTRN